MLACVGDGDVNDASDEQARMREQITFYREQARQHPPIEDDDRMKGLLRSYWEDPEVQHLVRSYCPPSARALELASGAGRWTGALLDVCQRITTVARALAGTMLDSKPVSEPTG